MKRSVYNLVHGMVKKGKIASEELFALPKFFWPDFIQMNGCYFLKDEFTHDRYQKLVQEKENPEFWINLLIVDDYFSECDDWKSKSIYFSHMLATMWTAKLTIEFPYEKFLVQCVENQENGDYGLTFYQEKFSSSIDLELKGPTIRENELDDYFGVSFPGRPMIRKAELSEIPGGERLGLLNRHQVSQRFLWTYLIRIRTIGSDDLTREFNMFTPNLGFVLLFVSNPQNSSLFYQKILGIQPIEESPTFVLFALQNGVMLGLWSKYTAEPRVEVPPGALELCFPTADVDALYKGWGEKRVTIAQKPTDMDFGRTFVALDPDGHRIRVYKLFEDKR